MRGQIMKLIDTSYDMNSG